MTPRISNFTTFREYRMPVLTTTDEFSCNEGYSGVLLDIGNWDDSTDKSAVLSHLIGSS